jgi:hypothetical protein
VSKMAPKLLTRRQWLGKAPEARARQSVSIHHDGRAGHRTQPLFQQHSGDGHDQPGAADRGLGQLRVQAG